MAPSRGASFVAVHPAEITACLYGRAESSVLRGSGRLVNDAAAALVTLLNEAPPGRNPESPAAHAQRERRAGRNWFCCCGRASGP